MTEFDENGLGAFIDAHYKGPGDRLFRMERLPHYAVAQQAAELQAWRKPDGQPDMTRKNAWLEVLAREVANGMHTQRVRVLSADLTDDEQRACNWGYPYVGQYEDVQVLHRGEHPVPDILDHDYWIIEPVADARQILRMRYTDLGGFIGADRVPLDGHGDYLRERKLALAVAEPFDVWWTRHGEWHRRMTA